MLVWKLEFLENREELVTAESEEAKKEDRCLFQEVFFLWSSAHYVSRINKLKADNLNIWHDNDSCTLRRVRKNAFNYPFQIIANKLSILVLSQC